MHLKFDRCFVMSSYLDCFNCVFQCYFDSVILKYYSVRDSRHVMKSNGHKLDHALIPELSGAIRGLSERQ